MAQVRKWNLQTCLGNQRLYCHEACWSNFVSKSHETSALCQRWQFECFQVCSIDGQLVNRQQQKTKMDDILLFEMRRFRKTYLGMEKVQIATGHSFVYTSKILSISCLLRWWTSSRRHIILRSGKISHANPFEHSTGSKPHSAEAWMDKRDKSCQKRKMMIWRPKFLFRYVDIVGHPMREP